MLCGPLGCVNRPDLFPGWMAFIFRLTLQSRHDNAVSDVRPSTKNFFDFCEIWHVGISR